MRLPSVVAVSNAQHHNLKAYSGWTVTGPATNRGQVTNHRFPAPYFDEHYGPS